jgi:glycosyltransferase involved in cell wall biosynthesis
MPSLWFIVPAYGRAELARICLRQLRRTCDALDNHGIDATAVVIADDENLDTADELGFGTVNRDNRFLSRKFNDGIQFALDPQVNPRPADYVVPCGSDDWIDYRVLLDLPTADRIGAFQWMSFVREDGREISTSRIGYPGGCGLRVYPRPIMERVGYRPADEDRARACDTSILVNVTRSWPEWRAHPPITYLDKHPRQIVDWKNTGTQINSYQAVAQYNRGPIITDPFRELADTYPAEALEEMASFYGVLVAA